MNAEELNSTLSIPRERLRKANFRRGVCYHHEDGTRVEFWSDGRRVLILHDSRADGWDIYKPASTSNNVEATLKAAGL